jgi:hypothetical protein
MFPVDDWQFWVVTALALGAAAFLLRGLLPDRLRKKRRGNRTKLTIDGKPTR